MAIVKGSGAAGATGVCGALVQTATGATTLHLSLPHTPLTDRKSRRWVRARVNEHAANAPGAPVIFHRVRKDGTVTNSKGWLAWL